MPTFQSASVEIAYIDEGPRGGLHLPALLIHGFASNVDMNWISTQWVAELTRAGYRVVAYDNRGHGKSEKLYDPALYGAPTMAEDARRLLDHLGIDQAHVIGYSMGARISAFLAMAHPERVRSLVLGGYGINMVRGLAGTGPIAHALEAAHIDEVKNATARSFRAFAEQTQSDLRAMAACIRGPRDRITEEALGGLRCPVLVAVGSGDVIGGSAAELAALIPGAEAFVIEGRDHMKAVGDRTFKAKVLEMLARSDTARS
jgi:pimeloyl-ACP methyl ester carboxylesterase